MAAASAELPTITFAVLGGTGIYGVEGMTDRQEVAIETPYGKTSSPIVCGKLNGLAIAFVARHGFGHNVTPTEVPYRANIWALKKLGVKYLLALSACGSLREEIAPRDIVLVDQFFDRTKGIRNDTFFGNGVVAHVAMGEPVCAALSKIVQESIPLVASPPKVHVGGTYIAMEGPAFSTRAESNVNRTAFGGSVIGMTAVPEFKLAREAEIAYCLVALVTDYDCWHSEHASVSVDVVMNTLKQNGDVAQRIVVEVIKKLQDNQPVSEAHSACQMAVMTPRKAISDERYAELEIIIGKYVK